MSFEYPVDEIEIMDEAAEAAKEPTLTRANLLPQTWEIPDDVDDVASVVSDYQNLQDSVDSTAAAAAAAKQSRRPSPAGAADAADTKQQCLSDELLLQFWQEDIWGDNDSTNDDQVISPPTACPAEATSHPTENKNSCAAKKESHPKDVKPSSLQMDLEDLEREEQQCCPLAHNGSCVKETQYDLDVHLARQKKWPQQQCCPSAAALTNITAQTNYKKDTREDLDLQLALQEQWHQQLCDQSASAIKRNLSLPANLNVEMQEDLDVQLALEAQWQERQYLYSSSAVTVAGSQTSLQPLPSGDSVSSNVQQRKPAPKPPLPPAIRSLNHHHNAKETERLLPPPPLPSKLPPIPKDDFDEIPDAASNICDEFEREALLLQSTVGRAWKLVERLLILWEAHSSSTWDGSIAPVSRDDTVAMAEQLIETQHEQQQMRQLYNEKCSDLIYTVTSVDIGYHWTQMENMERIRTDGLLTKMERDSRGIQARYNGSSYGDGVYTASDPFAFSRSSYGDTCIMVARVRGRIGSRYSTDRRIEADTVEDPSRHMSVLKSSKQCFPVFTFHRSLLQAGETGKEIIKHCQVQTQKVLDNFLNEGRPTPVSGSMLEPQHMSYTTHRPLKRVKIKTSWASASKGTALSRRQSAADSHWWHFGSKGDSFIKPILLKTVHVYTATTEAERGPNTGDSPSATMVYLRDDTLQCQGYQKNDSDENNGTIVIKYLIEKGLQHSYHPNPGEYHDSLQRIAFLPANPEGETLLKRLECAFLSGWMFGVMPRRTPSNTLPNEIAWMVPHKTVLAAGVPYTMNGKTIQGDGNGYPDPDFFRAVNFVLDSYNCESNLSVSAMKNVPLLTTNK